MQLHRSCTLFFVTYFDRQTSTHRLDQNFILLLILILLLELRVERRGVSRVVGEGFTSDARKWIVAVSENAIVLTLLSPRWVV